MNKTEEKGLRWLLTQYPAGDIRYQHRHSPDFVTSDGKGWEVKLLREGTIVFSEDQLEAASRPPDCLVLVFDGSAVPVAIFGIGNIKGATYLGGYRIVLLGRKAPAPAIVSQPEPEKEIVPGPEAIRECRGRLGLSQAQLAHEIGVSPQTVARWEVGMNRPQSIALHKLREIIERRGR